MKTEPGATVEAPTVFIVHGYNVRDPRRLFRLASFFEAEGVPVIRVDYGWTGFLLGLLRVRFITPREAIRLVDEVRPGDIGLGHSNGCAVLHKACELGAPFERLIYLNPALRSDSIPENPYLQRMYALATPDDMAVLAGEWLRRLSPLRLFGKQTPWGAMGRWGYTGDDPRGRTVWLHRALGLRPDAKVGHSGAYRWDRLQELGDLVVSLALDELDHLDEQEGQWAEVE